MRSVTARPSFSRGDRGRVVLVDAALGLDDLSERPEGDALAVRQAAAVPPRDDLLVVGHRLAELCHEPALADPRDADERHQLRRAVDPDPCEGAQQERTFVLAADEWHGGVATQLADTTEGLDRLPHLDRLGLALRGDGIVWPIDDHPLGRAMGRSPDEDPVDRRGRLDPRGGVHHVTRDHRLPCRGRRVDGDQRLAGRDADPHVEIERIVSLVQLRDGVAHSERCADGAFGIVLVRRRRAVDGDHGVADELLDRAAVALQVAPERLVVAAQERADVLGIELLRARRRPDEIDEDRGDDLPLLRRSRPGGQHRSAGVAEPCIVRVLAAAVRAGDHAASVFRPVVLDAGDFRAAAGRCTRRPRAPDQQR